MAFIKSQLFARHFAKHLVYIIPCIPEYHSMKQYYHNLNFLQIKHSGSKNNNTNNNNKESGR